MSRKFPDFRDTHILTTLFEISAINHIFAESYNSFSIMSMNKLYSLLLSSLLLSLASCEEPDAALRFDIESTTDSNAVNLQYFSADPSCLPKSYTLYVDEESDVEITLVCTNNEESLCFYNTPNKYLIAKRYCSAKINGSTITITCRSQTDLENEDSYTILPVKSEDNPNLSTSIAIQRCPKEFLDLY